MIDSTNKGWGFYGALDAQAEAAWPLALAALQHTTGFDEADCAAFLDSRSGRHFGDSVRNEIDSELPLQQAIEAAVRTWSGWPLSRRMRTLYDIPKGATYLQGFVAVEAFG